jgi:hypothetical protein
MPRKQITNCNTVILKPCPLCLLLSVDHGHKYNGKHTTPRSVPPHDETAAEQEDGAASLKPRNETRECMHKNHDQLLFIQADCQNVFD